MDAEWPNRWLQSMMRDCVIGDRVRLCDFRDTRATVTWAFTNRPREILRERFQLDRAWPTGRRSHERLPNGSWARLQIPEPFSNSWRGVMRAARLMELDSDAANRWPAWQRFHCVPVYLDTYPLGTLCLEVNSRAFRAMLRQSRSGVIRSSNDADREVDGDNFDGIHAIAAAAAYIRLWHEGKRRQNLSHAVVDALLRHCPDRRHMWMAGSSAENRVVVERLAEVRERYFATDVLEPSQVYDLACLLGICSQRSSIVQIVDVTPRVIELLRRDPEELYMLTPSAFEKLIANRLGAMGYDVISTGAVFTRDGGIDLIAVPKTRTVGSFLLAAQVKHHHVARPTTRSEVDRLLAWKDSVFRLGLIVTNTWFTSDARWLARKDNNAAFLRLREFNDLRRWLWDNFADAAECQELPQRIDLAPGIAVDVPKLRLPTMKRDL